MHSYIHIYTHIPTLADIRTASKVSHKLLFFLHVYLSIFQSRSTKLVPIDPSPYLKFVIFLLSNANLLFSAKSLVDGSQIGILCVFFPFFSWAWNWDIAYLPPFLLSLLIWTGLSLISSSHAPIFHSIVWTVADFPDGKLRIVCS